MRRIALAALTTHQTREPKTLCNCITWIKMGIEADRYLLSSVHVCNEITPSFTSRGKECGVDFQFSSTICFVVCKRQLSYLDANAAVLLHVATTMQTHLFVVPVAPKILWKISPIWCLHPFLLQPCETRTHVWVELEFRNFNEGGKYSNIQ
jgi:hypothetical protein